jgi:predicted MFS family arabinose efflux permease
MFKKEFWNWMITVRSGAFFLTTFFALIFLIVPLIPHYEFPYSWIISVCAVLWWWFGNVYRLFTIWIKHVKDE